MTKDIYDQYATATKAISGYAILFKGEYIGKVVFKRGNCRVTCYAHIHGLVMTKGIAKGGGYDMNSAAVYAAMQNAMKRLKKDDPIASKYVEGIYSATKNDGQHWDNALTKAGYTVLAVV